MDNLASVINEPPNIFSLLHDVYKEAFWGYILHDWENILFSLLVAVLVIIVFQIGVRQKTVVPTGLQNFLEFLAESLSKLVYGVLGSEGEKYFPFLATLFVYILAMNLFGLIPLMKSPSASLNVAIALAICVFVLVQYLNIKNMGFLGFLYHLAGSPKGILGWLMVPLMLPIEILTQISRPLTLALRLFGNIFGEEALIGYFTLLGVFAFAFFELPVDAGLPLQIPFMFLGMLTSLMQALVFTLLSTVYILLSIPHEENHSVKE